MFTKAIMLLIICQFLVLAFGAPSLQPPSPKVQRVKKAEAQLPQAPASNPYDDSQKAKRNDLGLSGPQQAEALAAANKVVQAEPGKRGTNITSSSPRLDKDDAADSAKKSSKSSNKDQEKSKKEKENGKKDKEKGKKDKVKRFDQAAENAAVEPSVEFQVRKRGDDADQVNKRGDAEVGPDAQDDQFDKAAEAELKRQDAQIQKILNDAEVSMDKAKRDDANPQQAAASQAGAASKAHPQKRNDDGQATSGNAKPQQVQTPQKRNDAQQQASDKAVPQQVQTPQKRNGAQPQTSVNAVPEHIQTPQKRSDNVHQGAEQNEAKQVAQPKQKRYLEYRKAMIGR